MKQNDEILVINDKVLPGNDRSPDISNGQTYKIKSVHICKCGELHIDIGLTSTLNFVTCYKCREELPRGEETHWCHSSRFEYVVATDNYESKQSNKT